jgi:hypothetical protein
MEQATYITTFDNKIVDISKLTIDELWFLHYEQEKSFADLIKKTKPFSIERAKLMNKGYETINRIMIMRSSKKGKKLESYGAMDAYAQLVKKMVRKVLNKKEKCFFFEAGVGSGKVIKDIAILPNVIAAGCDVYVDKNYISSDLKIYECTIYDALLKLDNNSIDVFYWNDVIEHIPEDEIEEYIKLLSVKMAIGGIIITITPNRLGGPYDITRYFKPIGSTAEGFHFHEYTFQEILTLFYKYNIVSAYGIFGFVRRYWYILSSAWIIDKIKLFGEKLSGYSPLRLKKYWVVLMGCDTSILKKKEC